MTRQPAVPTQKIDSQQRQHRSEIDATSRTSKEDKTNNAASTDYTATISISTRNKTINYTKTRQPYVSTEKKNPPAIPTQKTKKITQSTVTIQGNQYVSTEDAVNSVTTKDKKLSKNTRKQVNVINSGKTDNKATYK